MALQDIPIQTLTAGSYSTVVNAPNKSTETRITLQSDDWVLGSGLIVIITIERSENNGQTWEPWGGATVSGGARDRFGNMPSFSLTYPEKSGYRIKGTCEVNQTCRLGFQVSAS